MITGKSALASASIPGRNLRKNPQRFALYFGNRGFFPEKLIAEARRELAQAVEGAGYETVSMPAEATRFGAVESVAEGRKYASWLQDQDGIDGVILCLPNFGDETGAVAALEDAGVPIWIMAYPDEKDAMGFADRRDAFCGKFSVMDVFYQYRIPYTSEPPHVIHPGDARFPAQLGHFAAVCRVVRGCRRFTIGAIGARTTAFKTVRFDELAMQKYGVTVETLDLSDVFARVKSFDEKNEAYGERMSRLGGFADMSKVPDESMANMVKLSLVLDALAEEYRMDAMAVRCWIEMEEQLKVAPCALLGELNDRGVAAACELDVANALTMHALKAAAERPATVLDWNNNWGDEEDKCILFHCGPVPGVPDAGKRRGDRPPDVRQIPGTRLRMGSEPGPDRPHALQLRLGQNRRRKNPRLRRRGSIYRGCHTRRLLRLRRRRRDREPAEETRHHRQERIPSSCECRPRTCLPCRSRSPGNLSRILLDGIVSLLGLDIGTSGCKIIAVSEDGRVLGEKSIPHAASHPSAGYAELDSRTVWENILGLLQYAGTLTTADPATALSVSSFGEAVVPVDSERNILGVSILGPDIRGESYALDLEKKYGGKAFYEINPNIISLCYTYPKVAWIRDNDPELYERTGTFLHWGDFALHMCGADLFACNSLANRSLLFDLRKNDWSDQLFAGSGLDRGKFGKIADGGSVVGALSGEMAGKTGLPENMVLVAGGHDQCLNALGAGAIRPGSAVCGIGTFECITPVFSLPEDFSSMGRLGLNIEHHVLPDLYLAFIYNQAGSVLNWYGQTLLQDAVDIGTLESEIPDGPTGLFALPYFEPTGSPGFVNDMCGAVVGMNMGTSRGEIFKGIMESVVYYFHEVMEELRDEGITFDSYTATGGGSRSIPWLQIHADVFGVPFRQPEIPEGSALGAALLAGLGTGVWKDAREAAENFVKIRRIVEPDMARHREYGALSEKYRRIYRGIRSGWCG